MTTHFMHAATSTAPIHALFACAAFGEGAIRVDRIEGEEDLGRAPRFEISFACSAEIEPADAVGASARLVVGARTIGGVIADIESLDARADGSREYRITLAPRAWLLSRGLRSRVFSGLSTPEIVEAVVAASGLGLRVETSLRDTYPARPSAVQHRESDLDFILRLVERDGICLRVDDDGERSTLSLTDHNDALPSVGDLLEASQIRRKSALLPHRIELASFDPARPELPLRASAIVSEAGSGDLEIHDLPFSTPEEGARAARLHAERLRSKAMLIHGNLPRPIVVGSRASVAGREILVTSLRHTLSVEGAWTSRFTAIPASTSYRPELRMPAKVVNGLRGGRLAPWDHVSDNRARVRDTESAVDRVMTMAGGAAFEREISEGAEIVWGCVDGDPERPIITAVLSSGASFEAPRAVLRGPRGAVFEMGGIPAVGLGETQGMLDGARVPPVAHHTDGETTSYTSGTGNTDTWMRFGVPHYAGSTTSGWSYLRIGEAAIDASAISSTDGSTFSESADKCIKLDVNSYDASGLAGVFDFTDKNRTTLTKGNSEQTTKGVLRVAAHADKPAPQYELNVGRKLVSENIGGASFNYTDGTELDIFGGLKIDASIGAKVDASLGGNFNFDLGFMFNATAGYRLDYVHADSFEVRKGEELSSASTIDKRASEKIQFSIHPGGDTVDKETKIAAAVAVAAALGIAITADVTERFEDEDGYTAVATGVLGLAMIATFATMRYRSIENELKDGNPILSLDSGAGKAALRADDWLLLMTPKFAVLGKNSPFEVPTPPAVAPPVVTKIANLELAKTGTAVVIEEDGKIRLQTADDKTNTVLATLSIVEKRLVIQADEVEIMSAAGGAMSAPGITLNGPVTIKGKLTVESGGIDVTGDSKIKGKIKGGTSLAELDVA